jgi:hypothetical protein
LSLAGYIRRSIKQYVHYMRVREILFLLEIADTVSRNTGKNIFAGLEPGKKPDKKEGKGGTCRKEDEK